MLRFSRLLAVLAAAVTVVGLAHSASAPRNRVVHFADLQKWAQSTIPRDVRHNARIVGVFGDRTIVVAPTRNGNFCVAYVGKRGRGWGGCRARGPRPDSIRGDFNGYLVGASITGTGQTIRIVSGATLAGPDALLSIVYADGGRQPLSTVRVDSPIRAGFYYYAIPKPHRTDSRRPTAVELRGRDGRLIARQAIYKPILHR